MRKSIILALALSLTLSGCASNGQNGTGGGGINFGDVLLTGLGLAAAGASMYYSAKLEAKNRDDGADYCSSRYTGKQLRNCIASTPVR
jgi:hypothetical protein